MAKADESTRDQTSSTSWDASLRSVPEVVPRLDSQTVFLTDSIDPGSKGPGPSGSERADFSSRPVPMHPGELLGGTRYRLVRWLGDGGMGTVFEAVHEDLDRSVALKVLRSTSSTRSLDLFRQEAKMLGRLGSRFVVDVHDFIELADGRLVIVMELLRGETLREVVKRGPIPIERLLPIARQITKGLGAAHRVGVVHRDIKPENISLEVFEGRDDAVKLLDFGIAQIVDDDAAVSRAGTPGYLAPEVFSGSGADSRSDLYALGCTLYELASGRRPFEEDDPSNMLYAHLGKTPASLASVADVPEAFCVAVMRCLEKEPAARFESSAHLEVALCEAQISANFTTPWDDLPLPSVDADIVERLRRQMPTPRRRANRRWLALAVAGVLVVAAGGVWAGYAVRDDEVTDAPGFPAVDLRVDGARQAASRAFFVYPPPEEPSLTTAFGFVVQLEQMSGPGSQEAGQRAAALRAEFADTLERLGDRYWEAQGGKPFALDYYAEALVFEPGRERARRRASMTPGELRLLRSKAQTGDFSEVELAEVEPLIALSDLPKTEKDTRIERIEARSTPGVGRRQQLRSLAQRQPKEDPRGKAPDPRPDAEAAAPPEKTVDVGVPAPDPVVVADEPNSAPARALTRQADEAHRRGDSSRAEALYSEALSADRRHADAYRGLGRIAFDRGSYSLAARRLRKAVRLAPRSAGLRIELGDALFKSFDYDGAHAQYQRAADLGSTLAKGRLAKVAKKR